MHEYEAEAQKRWGETGAFKQSKSRTSQYSAQDFQEAKIDQEAAPELFAYAFGNSLSIDSEKTQEAVQAHRKAISKWFCDCSIEMQKNLTVMYLEDPRIKEYYDGRVRGLAQFLLSKITRNSNS